MACDFNEHHAEQLGRIEAKVDALRAHEERISSLERFRAKALGIVTAIAFLWGSIKLSILSHLP